MSTLQWSVRLSDEPQAGQPTLIGYGDSPQAALAQLHATIEKVADDAMEWATRQTTYAAKIRAEVQALAS